MTQALSPVKFGIVGLGGYANTISNLMQRHAFGDGRAIDWVIACEPDQTTHAARIAELRGLGVKVVSDFDEVLESGIEAVWLPLPIDLHRPYTERALAAGIAVMTEKPAAGCIDDVDAMIAARDKAKLPVAVGFQDMYDVLTWQMKAKLLDGELGKLEFATLHACWPRTDLYYNRNKWSARFKRNDVWVMDNPANNALCHYLNLSLFLLGEQLWDSARLQQVEAELYRANPIEGDDTLCYRVTTKTGAQLLILLTHACQQTVGPIISLHGTGGSVTRTMDGSYAVTKNGSQHTLARTTNPREVSVPRFCELVRGIDNPELGYGTLEIARTPTLVVNGAAEASDITTIPAASLQQSTSDKGTQTFVPGIEQAWETCMQKRVMLHESGLFDWTRPAGRRNLEGYKHFAGPLAAAQVSS